MSEEETYDPNTRRDLFVSMTGKKHLFCIHTWGPYSQYVGPACTSRFTMGSKVSGLSSDIDCINCMTYVRPGGSPPPGS